MTPLQDSTSKEAHDARDSSPPRPQLNSPRTTVPLQDLWKAMPQTTCSQVLRRLTQIVNQKLVPPATMEATDE